ncbi:MAG: NUDIX hydrolase [Candidatus Sungbacteria bacterium]|nr:NUDIX hydrolase [Candidatus Sungbacteria bacterium]
MDARSDKLREGLPEHARMVFKGVIFEVWQWEQEMFDGTMEIFEKAWRPATVEIIATVGDKILMEEQDQPNRKNNINTPSGRIEEGEDALDAAKRELLEETGYASDQWSVLFKHGPSGKVLHEVHYFIARNCRKVQEPHLDAGEKIETKLITFDDFMRLTEEPRFWMSPEFITYLLRLQADSDKKEEFRKLLFP